jgi:hypothetical protein
VITLPIACLATAQTVEETAFQHRVFGCGAIRDVDASCAE